MMRVERSALAVPGSNWRMIEKGLASEADVAILDLEDAVAPDAKAEARGTIVRALTELNWRGKPRTFRMNALDTPFWYRDLIEIVEAAGNNLDVIVVPKVNRPEDVHAIATLLSGIEAASGIEQPIGLEVQIETAEGLQHCEQIAAASPRVEAIVFGPGDYSASLRLPLESIGVAGEWDELYPGHRYGYPMHRILAAGRAAGIRVIDGPYADYRDPDGHRRSCLVARALGYDGKWCIHPGQIDATNEIFAPSARELEWAQRVIAAYDEANRAGKGAVALDNRMIDAANIRMAQVTVEQARVVGLIP